MSAGMDCWQRNHMCVPHRSSCGFLSVDATTSAMEEMATARNTDIANRISQLSTNSVSERAARCNAEQHVTVRRQRSTISNQG